MPDQEVPELSGEPSSPSARIRASDAEREAAVECLRAATAEGRLTLTELTERTEAAYQAVTRGDLVPITADLPSVPEPAPRSWQPAAQAGRGERIVAVFGDNKRRGRWRVDRPLDVLAVFGEVVIDLRDAEVPHGHVEIAATAVFGELKVYVPDGVDVRVVGTTLIGERVVKVREPPPGRQAPTLTIKATVVAASLTIRSDSYVNPVRRTLKALLGIIDDPNRRR
jgi:hypothetical protein